MTPDDVAAIRASAIYHNSETVRALCDALEAAWAEIDGMDRPAMNPHGTWTEERAYWVGRLDQMRERAERAETRNAEIQVWIDLATKWAIDPTADARALARVRALCDEYRDNPYLGHQHCVSEAEIHAAIEGEV